MNNVQLLPLPEYFRRDLSHMTWKGLSQAAINYASACVEANTEALRAEVAKERDYAAQAANRVLKAELVQRKAEARAERLAEALRWALPLASQGLEMYRLERLRCGHGDITGTYKNGETWAGIHQEEVDGLERALAALEQG